MAMMQMTDVFRFGKHKGQTLSMVANNDPGYLCWLRKTGFSELGKDATLFLDGWEEHNPDDVRRIERSVERKKKEEAVARVASNAAARAADATLDDNPPITKTAAFAPTAPSAANASWGSW